MATYTINNGEVNGAGDVVVTDADLGVTGPSDGIVATIEADPALTDDIDEILLPNLGRALGDVDRIEFDLTNFADDFTVVIPRGGGSSAPPEAREDFLVFPGATIIAGPDGDSDPTDDGFGAPWTLEYVGSDGNTYTITVEVASGDDEDDTDDEVAIIVCFTRGTLIKTAAGEAPVETLSVGDEVLTVDGSYQTIRWIGSNRVSAKGMAANPKLLPIRIRAGALGPGVPSQDLVVSRQHRVLVRSVIAERMFDTGEVLIPANKLLILDGVDIEHEPEDVEYWHFLFDAHQVVWSNGAPTESLFTGPEALRSVSPEALDEIMALFPEIALPGYVATAARPIPEKGKHMNRLAQRHQKNHMPIFEDA